jgi:hypothetical protein
MTLTTQNHPALWLRLNTTRLSVSLCHLQVQTSVIKPAHLYIHKLSNIWGPTELQQMCVQPCCQHCNHHDFLQSICKLLPSGHEIQTRLSTSQSSVRPCSEHTPHILQHIKSNQTPTRYYGVKSLM